jgi:hypothetical protein
MKKIVRISVLSVLVLTAMAFSAFSVIAMTPGSETGPVDSAMVAAGPKQEVTGMVTAVDATSITLNGTVYTLSASTQMHGSVQVGDTVKLEIVTNLDGGLTVYEVSKPDSSGASVDVAGTEPASIDPVGTETVSPDKSNVSDPTSTVEPAHTEDVSSDKGPSTDSSHDKNNSSTDIGQASGHDNSSGSSHPEPVDTSSAPAGNDQ